MGREAVARRWERAEGGRQVVLAVLRRRVSPVRESDGCRRMAAGGEEEGS